MENTVVITPQTAKQQRTDVLMSLTLGGEFNAPDTDRHKWAHTITNHVHPLTDRRFSVISDKSVVPEGKIIVRRIK